MLFKLAHYKQHYSASSKLFSILNDFSVFIIRGVKCCEPLASNLLRGLAGVLAEEWGNPKHQPFNPTAPCSLPYFHLIHGFHFRNPLCNILFTSPPHPVLTCWVSDINVAPVIWVLIRSHWLWREGLSDEWPGGCPGCDASTRPQTCLFFRTLMP